MRLFTRRGYDWTERFTAIAAAAAALRAKSFTIDGEAVVTGADGVAAFDELHGRRRLGEAFLWAFDLLEHDGADLRPLPFAKRKAKLARLLARAPGGVALNEHIEADGATVFEHARRMGLRASCRSGSMRPTGRAGRGTGSRSRTRIARRRCARGRGGGEGAASY